MRSEQTEMWKFKTASFRIVAMIEQDYDLDLSWDETGETREKLESGEWQSFGTTVTVYTKDGHELASDSLWGSIYAEPWDFFTEHRSADPMNRNCSAMRQARGAAVTICHYFPDMVTGVVRQAREALCKMPKVRCAA